MVQHFSVYFVDLVLFDFPLPESGIHYLSASANLTRFYTFRRNVKDILLSVSLPHFSCPACLEYLCPRALNLLRLRRYINHVLRRVI